MAFADLINRKYQIQQQTATSEANLRAAQAEQARSAAATNPAEAAAREAQAYGTAGAERGFGGYYTALGGAATARVPSEVGLAGAQAEQARAEAEAARSRAAAIPISGLPNLIGSGFGGAPKAPDSSLLNDNPENHAMGTSRINAMSGKTSVPGKMPPKGQNTDVTPANLTPGEAVLNRGAAEHLGRDVIDVLNAIGNIKMQGDQGASQTNGPVTKAPTDSENGVKGYSMGGVPGYADGMSDSRNPPRGDTDGMSYATGSSNIDPKSSGIDAMPGQGGYWGPTGDALPQPAPPASTQPKPQPSVMGGVTFGKRVGGVPGYADGMSDVPEPGAAVGMADGASRVMAATHADAARNSQAGEVGNDRKASVKAGVPKSSNAGEESTKGYAKGTSKVPGKGAKKPPQAGASKITPEMLQQLMALSKGGGGMIPPGQGASMPMPMPQVQGAGP